MRYVQVWFHCSSEGCEERAERLVEVRNVVTLGDSHLCVDTALPEGWGSRTTLETDRNRRDRERTYCPRHVRWTPEDAARLGVRPTIVGDPVYVDDGVRIVELANALGVQVVAVLRKVWGMGYTGISLSSHVDFDTAKLLGGEFGRDVRHVAFRPACARCGGSGTVDRGPPAGDGPCPECRR